MEQREVHKCLYTNQTASPNTHSTNESNRTAHDKAEGAADHQSNRYIEKAGRTVLGNEVTHQMVALGRPEHSVFPCYNSQQEATKSNHNAAIRG